MERLCFQETPDKHALPMMASRSFLCESVIRGEPANITKKAPGHKSSTHPAEAIRKVYRPYDRDPGIKAPARGIGF